MKRTVLMVMAALTLLMPEISAQGIKIDRNTYLKKIERSDADIANPKKAENAATWINRGKLFYEAETAVLGYIYEGMNEIILNPNFGMPQRGEERIGNNTLTTLTYPYFVAYMDSNGMLAAWKVTYVVMDGAVDKSLEAYYKAYEIDPSKKNADKVTEGLKNNYDLLNKLANNEFRFANYQKAGELFEKAYAITSHPAFGVSDTQEGVMAVAYNAGISYLLSHQYEKSVKYFEIAMNGGYEADGELYYYLYHAYKGAASENDKEVLIKSKEMLLNGLTKYSDNSNIIEALTDVYIALGDDPKDIVPIVKEAVEKNPNDWTLWNGLGRIYDKLDDTDNAIVAFKEVQKLTPDSFYANFNVGYFIIVKADKEFSAASSQSYSGQAEMDAALAKSYDIYKQAIPYLEKAHDLNPTEPNTVEMLKNVTFRLREMEGMTEKYNKYDALLKQMRN